MTTTFRALLLLGIAGAIACTDTSVGPTPVPPGLEIVAGPNPTDTVDATPAQALVAELRDATGQIVTGAVIRFTPMPVDNTTSYSSMLVAAAGVRDYGEFAADTTDNRGRAVALVRFGIIAGQGRVRIVAPELGIEQIAVFTIQPGRAARLRLLPADTTLYASAGLQLRGRLLDRYGNERADAPAYAVGALQPPLVSVSSTGAVTAGAGFGRATVTASAGAFRDSAAISVVPRGEFAAVDVGGSGGFVIGHLDGSGLRSFALPGLLDFGVVDPAWAPDASGVAFVDRFSRISILQGSDGAVSPLINSIVPGLGSQFSPAFSPDSRTVYFSGSNTSTGLRTIWRVGRDGSGARSISYALTGGDFSPSVEPAGQVAAFYTPEYTIRFVDLLSGFLVGTGIPGIFPEYSRTQDRLSLVTGEQVAVVNVDGTGFRIVTPPGLRYAQLVASWSPNGDWLLVRGESTLELIQVETGLRLPLPWSTLLTHPAWKPGS